MTGKRALHQAGPDLAAPPADPAGLASALRSGTAEAHARLEAALDLLAEPFERARFVRFLQRFHGFHAAWEPALAARADVADFALPRRRLGLIADDLARLGEDSTGLPVCREAAALAETKAGAIGSIYVLEGSTLGGKLIARGLADADWAPPGGLRYFDPYGAETGAMWRAFQRWARAETAPGAEPEVVAGARRAFDLLQAWLA